MSIDYSVIVSLLSSVLGATAVSDTLVEAFKKLFEEKKTETEESRNVPTLVPQERQTKDVKEIEAQLATDAAISVLDSTYASTSLIRDERMRQAKLAFNSALSLVVIGVLIIFIGVGLLWFNGSVEAGSITVAIGAITEIISVLLFKFNKEANQRLDDVRKELSSIETAKIGLSLAKEINNLEKRDEAIANLASQLQSKNG